RLVFRKQWGVFEKNKKVGVVFLAPLPRDASQQQMLVFPPPLGGERGGGGEIFRTDAGLFPSP
ncbi:hypothetical protein, partial [Escherichia coli]|uniref:hypothetical protein n=1 Tax=Escherichia coli TaxID=562 RepID=UPI002B24D4A6